MSLKGIKKVFSLSKVRSHFKQYEDRRTLCATYDKFLCDDRIVPALPRVLGKTFFSKNKYVWSIYQGMRLL